MDFLDSLKNIKKEMQANTYAQKSVKKSSKSGMGAKNDLKDLENLAKENKMKAQEINQDKEMQEIFLKQEKLQDEFLEFIKNSDIEKI